MLWIGTDDGLSRYDGEQFVTYTVEDDDGAVSNIATVAKKSGRSVDEVVADRTAAHPAGRFGDPAEFGEACAFLCGQQAGYITGQNLLIDGGAYPGTL